MTPPTWRQRLIRARYRKLSNTTGPIPYRDTWSRLAILRFLFRGAWLRSRGWLGR